MDHNSIAETNAQLIGSLIIEVGEIAKLMGEVLDDDRLTLEKREVLKRDLETSIRRTAVGLDHSRRGTGELLTRSFSGRLRQGGTSDAGGTGA
jgi:hypothetical protein